jgi:hypothetical protein
MEKHFHRLFSCSYGSINLFLQPLSETRGRQIIFHHIISWSPGLQKALLSRLSPNHVVSPYWITLLSYCIYAFITYPPPTVRSAKCLLSKILYSSSETPPPAGDLISKHKRHWNEQNYGHGFRRSSRPRMTLLIKASSKLLLCSERF